nr:response regulator [Candidatus Sulfurimonas ponti]
MNKEIIHDIGNYLHQIISHSELIENKSDSIDISEYAKKIKQNAYTIDAMISDSVSKKAEVDKAKLDFHHIDVEKFIGMKVMIVDDIYENVEIMKNIFKTFSCEIKSAKNAEEALELYTSGFHPEFISMDIVMPNTDGYETTRQLKALGSTAFFMVVSALKHRPHRAMSLFNYWLAKPFSMDDIIYALLKYDSM